MSTNFNTCFIDSNGRDVAEEFVEKSYLIDVYPNLVDWQKAPSLWTWGINSAGGLGDQTINSASSPVQTVSGSTNWKQICTNGLTSAAIKTDGTLWLWGYNNSGELGTNSSITNSSPVQTISAGTNWKQVSIGGLTSAAVKTDGTLWLWGDDSFGKMGKNTRNIRTSSPVQTVSAGTNWKSVDIGIGNVVAAIKTDGTLWLWGDGGDGMLGTTYGAGLRFASSPVQTVSAGTNWAQVSVGGAHVGAIKNDGTLWMWGYTGEQDAELLNSGSLGNNQANAKRSSPIQTVAGGTNWKQVSLGNHYSTAIKTDGTLWVWGMNGIILGGGFSGDGRLGTNNLTSYSSPVQTVSGGTNWKYVSAGCVSVAAIKTDGSLWTWGDGCNGKLGDNTENINRSSPVQTISGGTNWKEVEMGSSVIAIREEGDW